MRIPIILLLVCEVTISLEPDLTLLIHKNTDGYDFTCVATGDETLDYAMTWVFEDFNDHGRVKSVSKYADTAGFLDKFDHAYFIPKGMHAVENSLQFNLPRVLDQRWEGFEIFSTDPKEKLRNVIVFSKIQKISTLHISVLVENQAVFKIITTNGIMCAFFYRNEHSNRNKYFKNVENCEIIRVSSDWHHHSWKMYGRNRELLVLEMALISPDKAAVKIHDYNFLRISPNQTALLFVEKLNFLYQKNICLGFHLYMDKHCQLEMMFSNDDNSSIYKNKVWVGTGEWTYEKLVMPKMSNLSKAYLLVNSGNSSRNCSLIAIDDIRWCKLFDSRSLKIHTESLYNVSCASLGNQALKISYNEYKMRKEIKEDYDRYIGNNYNVTCSSIEEGEFCEKRIICNTYECRCAHGFCGTKCNEECPKEEYSDWKHHLSIPSQIRISKTTATTAQVSTTPRVVFISKVIADLGPFPSQSIHLPVTSNLVENKLVDLKPFTKYNVRFKFCGNYECTVYSETEEFITQKCQGFAYSNIHLDVGSSNITINIINKTDNHCPTNFYVLKVNKSIYKFRSKAMIIKGLQPNKSYSLKLLIDQNFLDKAEENEVQQFNIVTKPKELSDEHDFILKTVRNTEAVFDSHLQPHGIEKVNYLVEIQAVNGSTCHNDRRREIHRTNPIQIVNLYPYTKYIITITLVNEVERLPTSYEIFTLSSEIISSEESEIGISINTNAMVTMPKCNEIRGPLFYNLKSTCLEVWCNGSINYLNFKYNENEKLIQFINNLQPFSKHQLQFNIRRTPNETTDSVDKTFIIISPPTKSGRVLDPKVTNENGSLYITWKPPYPPTDIILGYIVEINNSHIIDDANCTEMNFCWIRYEKALPNVTYGIQISTISEHINEIGPTTIIQSRVTEKTDNSDALSNVSAYVSNTCDVILKWKHPQTPNSTATFLVKMETSEGNDFKMYDVPADKILGIVKFHNLSAGAVYDINIELKNSKFILKDTQFQIITCNWYLKFFLGKVYLTIVCLILSGVVILLISTHLLRRRKKNPLVQKNIHLLEDFKLLPRENKFVIKKENYCQTMKKIVCNNMYLDYLTEEYESVWDKMTIWYDLVFPRQFCRIVQKDGIQLNAHFVQGWRGVNTYIATQCPRGNYSGGIFWNMVYDKQIKIIVSLLTEDEAELANNKYCVDNVYHSDDGVLEVSLKVSQRHTDYVLREFAVIRDGHLLVVKHFNFYSFPYGDFPSYPTSFINFLLHVKKSDVIHSPVLVHCSDGFGRTGVFIMSYNFMRCSDRFVDTEKYLEDIRKCRPMLLNVFEQYQFVHYLLHQIYINYESSVSTNTFLVSTDLIREKIENDFIHLKNFKYTCKMYPGKRNIGNEIGATVVNGYENQCRYLAVKTVKQRNAYAFWKYVICKGIKIIIVLQNVDEEEKAWPLHDGSCSFDDIQVYVQTSHPVRQHNTNIYKLKILKIGQEDRIVTLLYYKPWNASSPTPTNECNFYGFLNYYHTIKSDEEEILLCCKDGITGCGLFICSDLILQRIKFQNTFDLVWAVHGLQLVNPNFMEHLDQHRFIYSLVKYYLDIVENENGYHQYAVVSNIDRVVSAKLYDILYS